jgi:hypothetical protein
MAIITLSGTYRVPKGGHRPRAANLSSAWLKLTSPFRPVPLDAAVWLTELPSPARIGQVAMQANKAAGLHGDLRWLHEALDAIGLRPQWKWLMRRAWSMRVVAFVDVGGDRPPKLGWMFDSPLLDRAEVPAWVRGMTERGFITTEPTSTYEAGPVASLRAIMLNRDFWSQAHGWPPAVLDAMRESVDHTPSGRLAFPWFGGSLPAPSEYRVSFKVIYTK